MIFSRLRQCPSVTMWIATCPSAAELAALKAEGVI